jgi:hypothetical protein
MSTRKRTSVPKNKTIKRLRVKTFSVSKPPKPTSSVLQDIRPVYEKLIEYGIPKTDISKYDNTHLRVKLGKCELSIVYLHLKPGKKVSKEKWWLESMLLGHDKLDKATKQKLSNIDIEDVREYKTVRDLYKNIVKLQKILV